MPDSQLKKQRVGVIGAGQLAQMMVAPAVELGIDLKVFAQDPSDSAAQISTHFVGDYRDIDALLAFAEDCDLITFEHELTPNDILIQLESELKKRGKNLFPSASTFLYSQNKIYMRSRFEKLGIKGPRWITYPGGELATFTFPLIAKLSSGGYDGRGVYRISNQEELEDLHQRLDGSEILIEELVDFSLELSSLVARNPKGEIQTWEPTLTVQSEGICTQTISPIPEMEDQILEQARMIAIKIAKEIDLVGVMAVEIFLVDGQLLVNEIALRPHNSGHWTIEGAETCQFEQHLRAVLNLPLKESKLRSRWAVMGNLLGAEPLDMAQVSTQILNRWPEIYLHDYCKEIKPGRKVGHLTAIGDDLGEVKRMVNDAIDFFNGQSA
jgi:5-(carboxyamino)imidazole ribonucleotide synthase